MAGFSDSTPDRAITFSTCCFLMVFNLKRKRYVHLSDWAAPRQLAYTLSVKAAERQFSGSPIMLQISKTQGLCSVAIPDQSGLLFTFIHHVLGL